MTDKQIFERVKAHLLKQGKRSLRVNPDKDARVQSKFAWWGDDGTKSAVGCLMTTSLYREEFEKVHNLDRFESHVYCIFGGYKNLEELLGFEFLGRDDIRNLVNRMPDRTWKMLTALEAIHDEKPSDWPKLLEAEGRRFNSLGEYMWGAL